LIRGVPTHTQSLIPHTAHVVPVRARADAACQGARDGGECIGCGCGCASYSDRSEPWIYLGHNAGTGHRAVDSCSGSAPKKVKRGGQILSKHMTHDPKTTPLPRVPPFIFFQGRAAIPAWRIDVSICCATSDVSICCATAEKRIALTPHVVDSFVWIRLVRA
jgi:hypothetical protein